MSTRTNNYGLIVPELTDTADITNYNENWQILDDTLRSHSKSLSDLSEALSEQEAALDATNDNLRDHCQELDRGGTGLTQSELSEGAFIVEKDSDGEYSGSLGILQPKYGGTGISVRGEEFGAIYYESNNFHVAPLPISHGGTGGVDPKTARESLGITEIREIKDGLDPRGFDYFIAVRDDPETNRTTMLFNLASVSYSDYDPRVSASAANVRFYPFEEAKFEVRTYELEWYIGAGWQLDSTVHRLNIMSGEHDSINFTWDKIYGCKINPVKE